MRSFWILAIVVSQGSLLATGCYGRSQARSEGWVGMPRAEIEAQWGAPHIVEDTHEGELLRWEVTRRWRTGARASGRGGGSVRVEGIEDMGVRGELRVGPGGFDAEFEARGPRIEAEGEVEAEAHPGELRERTYAAEAAVSAAGLITGVSADAWRWGPPRGANVRWGPIFGLHVGMGRLDSTSMPLPSGGVHIGGMLGPRHALVGTFSMVSGREEGRGAMGMSWGMEGTWWPHARTSLRAGPAMVLDWKPGFEDRAFGLAVKGGASYALLRSGSFVLDLRADITAHPSSAFGTIGIGVNRH